MKYPKKAAVNSVPKSRPDVPKGAYNLNFTIATGGRKMGPTNAPGKKVTRG